MAVINGTDSWEILVGSDVADQISGGKGQDTIQGLDGNDTIYAETFGDRFHLDNEFDLIDAGAGDDDITAGTGDRVIGGQGDDDAILAYRSENRPALFFDGGAGFDTLTLDGYLDGVSGVQRFVVAMDEWADVHTTADIRLYSVERLDLGLMGGGHVYAGAANNHITASILQDFISAGDGNDTVGLRAGGDDVVSGGEGEDTLSFESITSLVGVPEAWGLMVKLHDTSAQAYYHEAYVVSESPGPGIPTTWGYRPAGALKIESFEHFIGSSLRDTVEGSDFGNRLDGRAGNDELKGLDGTDTLLGGTGDDTLDGGADNDLLYGEDGRDKLYGGEGADTLFGGADTSADLLYGDGGSDSLDGGAGADSLFGGASADTLDGGLGIDFLDGGEGGDLLNGQGANYNDDTLAGGEGNDTLQGGYTGGVLIGGAGADRIVGTSTGGDRSYATASYIDSDEGIQMDRRLDSSTWSGDAKNDVLINLHKVQLSTHDDEFHGRGEGTMSSQTADDEIFGAAGNDTIFGYGGVDSLVGDSGNDSLSGGEGADVLRGVDGADYMDGGANRDILYGGAGNDTMVGGQGDDELLESTVLDGMAPTVDNDVFDGGDGADRIFVANGSDTVYGGAGDDYIEDTNSSNKIGHLHLEGGAGDDLYTVFRADFTVVEELAGGRDKIELNYGVRFNGAAYQLGENIEDISARSMFEAVQLGGNSLDNEMFGSRFNDTLSGGYGNDTISGHLGNDFIDGGAGSFGEERDVAKFSGKFSDYKFVTLENGDLQVTDLRTNGDGEGVDILRNIERLKFTDVERDRGDLANTAPTARPDAVTVDEDATTGNLYDLLLSNDTDADGDALGIMSVGLTGTKGSVVYDSAAKKLTYAADTDVFDDLKPGETATDTFTYTVRDKTGATSTSTVTVTITGQENGDDWISLTNGNDTRTFTDATERVRGLDGNDKILAGGGADTIDGGSGHDTIEGQAGADQLIGGMGDDRIVGGLGDVSLAGGEGTDTGVLDFSGAQSGVTFWLSQNLKGPTDAGGVQVSGFERVEFTGGAGSDYVLGGALNDVLKGNGGADTLSGGEGADTINGGAGTDVLEGGAGKDRFVFTSLDGDRISDWQAGDVVDVLGLEIYGLKLTVSGGATRVDFDVDGDGQFDDGQIVIQSTAVKITDFDW